MSDEWKEYKRRLVEDFSNCSGELLDARAQAWALRLQRDEKVNAALLADNAAKDKQIERAYYDGIVYAMNSKLSNGTTEALELAKAYAAALREEKP